ncbi:hypothetical protein LCGC14_1322150 [marine sediment metagenome]|uniref:Uncharacterized protein n=1 Tax=marine sediment metagenome TaxID=412755 RepID=A0A0F9MZY8_9ZZZZ
MTKRVTVRILSMLGYLAGIGLLVYAEITGDIWVTNIGLPLVLISTGPLAYFLSLSEIK